MTPRAWRRPTRSRRITDDRVAEGHRLTRTSMNLTYTEEQNAFRREVRSWLKAHVPRRPLPSFDASREGFEVHRQWERVLDEGRWGMVTWPERYGGRGLDLIQWLIF